MKLLLALAALLTAVGLVWLAISVDDATERGRAREVPVVTPVGVLTPADAAAEEASGTLLAAPPLAADEAPDAEPPAAPGPGAVAAPARPAEPWIPPDPARLAEKHRDLDAAAAGERSRQLHHRVEQLAASALADVYYREGRYTAWPYTYDTRGNRQPAQSSIPPAELVPIHRIYDAPDEKAWHLVVVTPEERPDLYDLRHEAKWLGSRGRSGDE